MAEARKVPAVTQVVTPEKVHLTLESREAAFLTVLLSKVGGSPTVSARAHSDSIAKALQGLGFRWDRLEEVTRVADETWADDAAQPAQAPTVNGSRLIRRRKGPWISGYCNIGRHSWCRETAKVPVRTRAEGFLTCACKTCAHGKEKKA